MLLIAAAIATCLSESIAPGSVQDVDRVAELQQQMVRVFRLPRGEKGRMGVEFCNRPAATTVGSGMFKFGGATLINANVPHVSVTTQRVGPRRGTATPQNDDKVPFPVEFRSCLSLVEPHQNLHKQTRQVGKVNILLFPAPLRRESS